MLEFNLKKTNCTGCTACKSICPTNCIKMEADEEGFLYPVKHNGCINCKLCEIVCPMCEPEQIPLYADQGVVAAVSKDFHIWQRSASGGAFSEICRIWSDLDTMIVGATMEELYVFHKTVIGFENIGPLCKSKYVGSDLEDVFIKIRSHLKDDHKVIFCGCPCQVAGLRKFLRKPYDDLLLIDLICHGVGSPLVFKECIDVISEDLGKRVVNYEFRAKNKVYETDYLTRITYEGGSCMSKQDPYISLFLSQNCLRPSCGENCIYRTSKRQGDITLADCKGLTEIFPDLDGCKKNYSSIVYNSEKGRKIVNKLNERMEVRPYELEYLKRYNPLFCRQTVFSKNRDVFFKEFTQNSGMAIRKWAKPFKIFRPNLKNKIYAISPTWLRRMISRAYQFIN